MNLHELERINGKACLGELVMQCKAEGEDAFLPVALEASDDMPYMALINLAVPIKDWICRPAVLMKFQDFLLVFTRNLGIGDNEGRDQCVGLATETASDTLDDE